MATILVELVKYDMDKTKKRKRANFMVDSKTESAIIKKLEKIHKGEKVVSIHEVIWGEEAYDEKESAEKFTGTVKFFNEEKGFGFIEADEEMDDLFFHVTSLGGLKVQDHEVVEFEVADGPKGLIAVKIKIID